MTPYLQKHSLYAPLISTPPSLVLGLVVVIPCHHEKDLLFSLKSLQKCSLPPCDVEIIIVINAATNANADIRQQNEQTYAQVLRWKRQQIGTRLRFHALLLQDLSPKHAGVGLARKIGMDEAVWRFEKTGNPRGVIACFDADTRCQPNYLEAVYAFFDKQPHYQAASIHFEHPLEGWEHPEAIYEGIVLYEFHLRYFVAMQQWAGFPFAHHTIGSSMAVRSDAYQQQGGMNRRKAGEDFYFLQKFIEIEKLGVLTATTTLPSPRVSNRVPFGTGKAVGDIIKKPAAYTTYAPQTFEDLRAFFAQLPNIYTSTGSFWQQLPLSVQAFVSEENWNSKITEIRRHTRSYTRFENRFYKWFNAFQLMKFVHFARDHFYPNIAIPQAAKTLAQLLHLDIDSPKEMLRWLRQKEKTAHGKVFS